MNPNKFDGKLSTTTLLEAKMWLHEMNRTPQGAICPCCSQMDKVYNRPIGISVIRVLANFYRYTKIHGPGYYHYTKFQQSQVGRDFPCFLRFLNLIERAYNTDKKKKTSGTYTITDQGIAFVERQIAIRERILVYHDELIGTVGDLKFINQFWPDFDYEQLMSEGPPLQ